MTRWVPRTSTDRRKMTPAQPRPLHDVMLGCGHKTCDEPVVTAPRGRRLYRCPEGCGLQRPTRAA